MPCPRCVQEKGDASLKDMFSIRGLGDGEHDAIIPSEWRNCPPIRLSDGTPGMSAVSVSCQYLLYYEKQSEVSCSSNMQLYPVLRCRLGNIGSSPCTSDPRTKLHGTKSGSSGENYSKNYKLMSAVPKHYARGKLLARSGKIESH